MLEIILSAIIALIVGGATTAISNASAKKREETARAENYQYNEMAAENADIRGRNFFTDIQSPKAQLEQLKEAGLSPSLFYSGGSAGGGTASTGAMGAGASGLLGQTFSMGTPREIAETRLMNAQADKAEQEATNLNPNSDFGKATLNQIIAETDNTHANSKLTEMQKDLAEITIDLQKGNIQLVNMKTKEAENNARYLFYTAENSKLNWQFNKETFDTRIKMIQQDLKNKTAEYLLTQARIELTAEEKAKVIAECEKIYTELFYYNETDVINAQAYTEWMNKQTDMLPKQVEALLGELKVHQGELDVHKTKMVLDFIGGLFNTAAHTAGMVMFGKAGMKGSLPSNPVYYGSPSGKSGVDAWGKHQNIQWLETAPNWCH